MFGIGFDRVSGARHKLQQFRTLLIKHVIHSLRNVIVTVVQIALPVIFTIIACVLEKAVAGSTNPPALPLNLSYFTNPIIDFSTGTGLSSDALSLVDSYSTIAGSWGTLAKAEEDMDTRLLDIAEETMDMYNRQYLIAGK